MRRCTALASCSQKEKERKPSCGSKNKYQREIVSDINKNRDLKLILGTKIY